MTQYIHNYTVISPENRGGGGGGGGRNSEQGVTVVRQYVSARM